LFVQRDSKIPFFPTGEPLPGICSFNGLIQAYHPNSSNRCSQ
jgi:hypothetical protein